MPGIADNLTELRQRIADLCNRAGRDAADVELIAVSKTRTLEQVRQAVAAGQRHFGENTMQDALSKIPQLSAEDLQWHFIGHLQSKKSGQIPAHFHWLHSLDSLKLAQKLSTAMTSKAPAQRLNCLIQVNVSGERSKSGLMPDELEAFVETLLEHELPGLAWRGLMTIGVQGDDRQTRHAFARLRDLRDRCRQRYELDAFDQLSMGMSADYAIAIEEGATLVRIGTAIFGPRNVQK